MKGAAERCESRDMGGSRETIEKEMKGRTCAVVWGREKGVSGTNSERIKIVCSYLDEAVLQKARQFSKFKKVTLTNEKTICGIIGIFFSRDTLGVREN